MGGWVRRTVTVLAWLGRAAFTLIAAVLISAGIVCTADQVLSVQLKAAIQMSQGNPAAAEALLKQAVVIEAATRDVNSPSYAQRLHNLGLFYQAQGRHAEAEPLFRNSLKIREQVDPDINNVAWSLQALGETYQAQARYSEAEPLLRRVLAIREKTLQPDDALVAKSLMSLASLYKGWGRYSDAQSTIAKAIAVREKSLGLEHPDVAQAVSMRGWIDIDEARFADAEQLFRRSLKIFERALGPGHPLVADALNGLAETFRERDLYAEAEPLYKRALAITEAALGFDHSAVGTCLNNLALLYDSQGRYADAESMHKRSLEIRERILGPAHPDVAMSLNNLGLWYQGQGRFDEAEPLYKRALAILENALGPNHRSVGKPVHNLANMYSAQGRYAEAEASYKREIDLDEKAIGADHPDYAMDLNTLGLLYLKQSRYVEAEELHRRALSIDERALGPDHPDVAFFLNSLAAGYQLRGDWAQAADQLRRAASIIKRRVARGSGTISSLTERAKTATEQFDWQFRELIKVSHRLAADPGPERMKLMLETFELAQWAQSSAAAQSLAEMVARSANGSGVVGNLARERTGLLGEWQEKDKLLLSAKSQPPAQRDAQTEKILADRLQVLDSRISEVDRQLAKDAPDYAALASPAPSSLSDIQSVLHDSEALVVLLDTAASTATPEESFAWIVTRSESRWIRSALGTAAITERVWRLRCGLDLEGEWEWSTEKRAFVGKKPVCGHLRPEGLQSGDLPPFDFATAHELYQALFAEAEELIQDKELLLVPSGPLTSLPFHVLVTAPPLGNDPASAAWLARKHALTVLPSVASLVALRRNVKVSAAPEPFVGFGDPILTGSGCGAPYVPDSCPGEKIKVTAAKANVTRSVGSLDALRKYFRAPDVAALKSGLCPLPDTEHELMCVARSLGAPTSSIFLGERMTERTLKAMPLDQFQIIHFATHGLLAGQTAQLARMHAEPALVFSPPDAPTEDDDGLLTASEITALKLDADWVVMSACNTASGGEPGAEALSGLARAFFYAGARALLVSHWPVTSYAATFLTSNTFEELKRNPALGRSEALRRSMLTLMSDTDRPWASHPSIWAPFAVVGEGATAK